jgi:hypothetical protein
MVSPLVNWMPEDDDPTLRHIPAQFGVPADDFNWPWYWKWLETAEKKAQARRMEYDAKCYRNAFIAIIIVVLMWCYLMFIH